MTDPLETPPPAIPGPPCQDHKEPCRAWQANRNAQSPNYGRWFWKCSRNGDEQCAGVGKDVGFWCDGNNPARAAYKPKTFIDYKSRGNDLSEVKSTLARLEAQQAQMMAMLSKNDSTTTWNQV